MGAADEKESLRKQVGRQVRVLRVMHGWTQEVLAELAGLHRNYVGYVERGERNAGIDNLERLATALGVPLRMLLEKEVGFLRPIAGVATPG